MSSYSNEYFMTSFTQDSIIDWKNRVMQLWERDCRLPAPDITHSQTRRDKTAITRIRIGGHQRKSSICIYREKTRERFEGGNTSYGKNAMCQSQWTVLFYSDV